VLPKRYGGWVERDLRGRSGARSAPVPSAAPQRARRSRSTLWAAVGLRAPARAMCPCDRS
jgi:hypothetical protein